MALPQWAAPLPQAPLGDGYEGTPHAAPQSSDMDQGVARLRQRSAVSLAKISVNWRMSREAFAVFQRFYREDLNEGARWFNLPLWFGGATYPVVAARFNGSYRAMPRAALSATVSADLDVRGFPVVVPDAPTLAGYFNGNGEAVWPETLPAFPLRSGYQIDPHTPLLRSDFDGGPANKSNLFGASPGKVPVSWVMTAAQFEVFKSFYWYGLSRGLRWYRMSLWFGLGLEEARVRFTGPWKFSPHQGDLISVSGEVSVRRIPLVDASVTAIFATMSASALQAFVPSLHHFVHTDYPAATQE